MDSDFSSWSPGRVCGALKALFEARCFGARTRDDVIMYDIGRYLKEHGSLRPKQVDYVRYRLPRYAKALSRLNIVEIPLAIPDGTGDYRFCMHNPKTLRVYAPKDSPILNYIRQISGFQQHSDGYFLVPFSKRNAYVLLHNGFVMGSRVGDFMARPSPPLLSVDFSVLRLAPKAYQCEGIQLLLAKNGRAILADEQGLGKTGQAIAWAELAGIKKICIVCPASIKVGWQREIEKWTGDTDCYVVGGRSIHADGEREIGIHRWVIINYDILVTWRRVLSQAGFSAFIFDEAQALKNEKAKRSKAAASLAKHLDHILMLSGTPCENRPAEFFPIIQMVDPLLFPSKIKYWERYCDLKQNALGFSDHSGASNSQELHRILTDTIMIRRKKADVLSELPDKQRSVVPLRIPASLLRNYINAERDFVSWLMTNSKGSFSKIEKKLKAQALLKLGTLKRLTAVAKVPLVVDWIQAYLENEAKLVVFAEQHVVIDALRQEFGEQAVVIDGRVPANKRQSICDAFQTDPKVRLFVGNLRAAGTGLTLTAAKDTVTIELGWTSTIHDQAEDRVHRIGQKNAVMAYYLLAEGTIEERIISLLDSKRTIISQIMDGEDPVDEDLLDELLKQYVEAADGNAEN